MARAGIAAQPGGVDLYVAARADWEPLVHRVAGALDYTSVDIDRRGASANPRHTGADSLRATA
ncbi:MAG: hypothetical protein EOO77_18190 [Oxalobacteraceae bacterium]|nr:MAG: hypothetical protein EOO77_18190 [Oxalobacteraceae bacterium]